MELLLVRHALPIRVEGGPGPADPALAPTGHDQARALATHWAPRVDALWTSPMRRARETVGPLEDALGVTATVDEDLAEMDRHADAYIPLEELRSDPAAWAEAVEAWTGPDGEALRSAFRARVGAAIDRVVAAHPGERVAVVCHGGVINAAAADAIGLGSALFFEPGYVSVSRVAAHRTGARTLLSLNETWHVDGSVPSGGTVPDGRLDA
jgi:broad specificity phosphatase PhoE